jgi:hypothetical protein
LVSFFVGHHGQGSHFHGGVFRFGLAFASIPDLSNCSKRTSTNVSKHSVAGLEIIVQFMAGMGTGETSAKRCHCFVCVVGLSGVLSFERDFRVFFLEKNAGVA